MVIEQIKLQKFTIEINIILEQLKVRFKNHDIIFFNPIICSQLELLKYNCAMAAISKTIWNYSKSIIS